jgi:hypothetical protein
MVTTNKFPEKLLKETAKTWKGTKRGKKLLRLLDGKRKWFIRLDQISPKDSPFRDKLPITIFSDIILRICSSMRAWNSLQDERLDAQQEGRDVRIDLILNPWDSSDGRRKRVPILRPTPCSSWLRSKCGSAGTQRCQPVPLTLLLPLPSLLHLAEDCNVAGANTLLEEMKSYMNIKIDVKIGDLLVKHGFAFDVVVQEDASGQLVEVNPFGALSRCGACLFHWVRDAEVMYGFDKEAEFRMTVDRMCAKYCCSGGEAIGGCVCFHVMVVLRR